MKTALLLTYAADRRPGWAEALGPETNLLLVPPPAEPTRAQFDALFNIWLRLADLVLLDAESLAESARGAIEALVENPGRTHQAVIVRQTPLQETLYTLPADWLALSTAEPAAKQRLLVKAFLDTRPTPAVPVTLPQTAAPAPLSADSYRYREALKTLARIVGQRHDEASLLRETLHLVRDLFGPGKVALFVVSAAGEAALSIAASEGIAPNVVEHLRLSPAGGIGAVLAREARILQRATATADIQVAREFELLGTEIAVPLFEHDRLLGVLTFSGKITGAAWSGEELELVFSLMAQLSQALRNLRLNEQLLTQQRLVSEVLANIQTGVLVVAQDGRLLSANPCARQLLDLGTTPLEGQRLAALPGRVGDVIYEVLETGAAVHEREVVLPGSKRPVRVSATRFAGQPNGARHWITVALVDDLTQIKRQQAQERELADKAFLTRLADRLSHELKNALVSVKIYAQLLPERYHDAEFREEFSRTMVNEVNRVDALINNLTFFSRPLGLVHETVDLGALLDAAVKNLAQDCARRRQLQIIMFGEKPPAVTGELPLVTAKCLYQHKAASVSGDRVRLAQAVEHMLRNAIQAMPHGGRLSVSTADAKVEDFPDDQLPAGGAVKIEVQDTGEGIPLERLQHVTEPFVTSRNVGIGLGLTIVKKIVDRHGGRLLLDSTLERGTTVTLLLPVRPQPHPEDGMSNLLDTAQSPAPSSRQVEHAQS